MTELTPKRLKSGMIRHVCIRAGNFMFENWHFYRYEKIHFGPKDRYSRFRWRKLI